MTEVPEFLRSPGEHLTTELVMDALIAAKGNITAAGRILLVRRTRIKNFIDTKPELIMLLGEIRDETIDQAEWNIFSAVEMGDQGASRFVLQTIGKDRGYVAREEHTGKNGKDLPTAAPTIVFRRYPDEPVPDAAGD